MSLTTAAFSNASQKPIFSDEMLEATRIGDIKAVRALLQQGADPNKKNEHSTTALILAALNGYTEIVRLLINNGADIHTRNIDGTTALMMAVWGGHTKSARLLIANGAEINDSNKYDTTVLIGAVLHNRIESVSLLIEKGIDFDKRSGITDDNAMDYAIRSNYLEIVQILKDAYEAPQKRAEAEAEAQRLSRVTSPALLRNMPVPKLIRPKPASGKNP